MHSRELYAREPQRRIAAVAIGNETKRERRDSIKRQILEALGGRCALCDFLPQLDAQIHLHELNGNISKRYGAGVWNPGAVLRLSSQQHIILDNLDEIVPLCANCHTLAHHKATQQETYRHILEWKKNHLEVSLRQQESVDTSMKCD